MQESFVQSFTHLKDRPKSNRALEMLQRIASLVKPIMRKHSWTLPVLAEFFPESPNLLDVNQGEKICLRLRPPHAPDTFLDEEHVVQTMLHELTHNVHGPHDEKFYNFLSKLQDEYDEYRRSGYAGEGFFSKGQRLGVNVSHDLPPHLARRKALEAAEARRQTARVLGGGGRLGGRAINSRGLSPRELAAQAAERRAHDDKVCGSGALAEREAAKDSIENKVIRVDLTMDSDTGSYTDDVIIVDQKYPAAGSSKGPVPPSEAVRSNRDPPGPTSRPTSVKINEVNRVSASGRRNISHRPKISHEWSCVICTLINQPQALQCDACSAERPPDRSVGWTCMTCGEPGIPPEFWSCRFCGTVKTTS
ncbi:WLM-domain-containing protein [Tricholoma matsutake]|nr:WLM-domain-containing protein [Tricholoma matsutake 945]